MSVSKCTPWDLRLLLGRKLSAGIRTYTSVCPTGVEDLSSDWPSTPSQEATSPGPKRVFFFRALLMSRIEPSCTWQRTPRGCRIPTGPGCTSKNPNKPGNKPLSLLIHREPRCCLCMKSSMNAARFNSSPFWEHISKPVAAAFPIREGCIIHHFHRCTQQGQTCEGLKTEQLRQITKDKFLCSLKRNNYLLLDAVRRQQSLISFIFFLRSQTFKGIETPNCHWEAETGTSKVLP